MLDNLCRLANLALLTLACACGGAQSGADEPFIPAPPEQSAPPDRAQTQTEQGAPPLQGPYWDLAVQARMVDARERRDWETSVRALDEEHRAIVISALEAIAGEELTTAGVRRAAGRVAAQRLPGGEGGADAPWVAAFQRGAVYVLAGMVARVGETVPGKPDPVAAGAELLRTIRAMRLPGLADPAPLLREAREAMGPSIAAQAEVRTQPRR